MKQNKQRSSLFDSITWLHILAAIAVSFSFISFWPYLPFSSWLAETTAFVSGLLFSATAFWHVRRSPRFHFSVTSAIFGIAIILCCLGILVNETSYLSTPLLFLAFLTLGFILSMAFDQLKAIQFDFIRPLLWGLLFGGIIQILFSISQALMLLETYTAWSMKMPLWVPHISPQFEAIGWMYQKNQLAHLLIVCSLATGCLYALKRISYSVLIEFLTFSSLTLALTSSRSVFVYAGGILAINFLFKTKNQYLKIYKKVVFGFVGLIILFQLLHPVITPIIASIAPKTSTETAVSRYKEQNFLGFRLLLWKQSLELFSESPWFGVGIGRLPVERAELQAQLPFDINKINSEHYSHAHNLFIHLLTENGLIFTLFVFLSMIFLLHQLLKMPSHIYKRFILLCLFVMFVHSMVEHPLWFAYFLVLFVFMLGYIQTPTWSLDRNSIFNKPLIAICLICLLAVFLCIPDYFRLVRMAYTPFTSPVTENEKQEMNKASRNPLLEPMAQFFYFVRIVDLSDQDLDHKIEVSHKLNQYRPVEIIFFRRAVFLSYAGLHTMALEEIRKGHNLFPKSNDFYMQWLAPIHQEPRLNRIKSQVIEFHNRYGSKPKK